MFDLSWSCPYCGFPSSKRDVAFEAHVEACQKGKIERAKERSVDEAWERNRKDERYG